MNITPADVSRAFEALFRLDETALGALFIAAVGTLCIIAALDWMEGTP